MEVRRRALVVGANGQDGSLMVEELLSKGWRVTGIGRQAKPKNSDESEQYQYLQVDIAEAQLLFETLNKVKPHHIFHAAAVHGSSGYCYETQWQTLFDVNVKTVHVVLEYLRENKNARITYLSSAKIFGELSGRIITETSQRNGRCLYSQTKIAAHNLIEYYRLEHNIRASIFVPFNHESRRRSTNYFLPRIVDLLRSAVNTNEIIMNFETLYFWGNWSSAKELMSLVVELADTEFDEDFVIGSPETVWAENLAAKLFAAHGLNWKKHINVIEKLPLNYPLPFKIDMTKLDACLGRNPASNAFTVAEELLRN